MTVEFPLTGKTCRVDYGELVVDHDYSVPGKVTYTNLTHPDGPITATVDIDVTSIRDGLFAVTFQDEVSSVVMIEDVAAGTIDSFMVMKADHTLFHLRGTLTQR